MADPDSLTEALDEPFIRGCIRQRERAIDLIDDIDRGRRQEFEAQPDGSKVDVTAKLRSEQLALVVRLSELIRDWASMRARRARASSVASNADR